MSRRSRLIKAIPTRYAGVSFRSRLEASWAGMWDRLGWGWSYEPDLQVGHVIPDFLLDFPHPVVMECKPGTTIEEVGEYRRKLILQIQEWLQDDVLRELRLLDGDPLADQALLARTYEDLGYPALGLNPMGHSKRILVCGARMFPDHERVTLDGEHAFCLCTNTEEVDHVGLANALGSVCLACGFLAEAWVPPQMILQAWREVCSEQQWQPRNKGRTRYRGRH